MANTKVTNLTELSVPDDDDLLYVIDDSDTTDDSSGSSRKILLSNLFRLPGFAATDISDITHAVNTGDIKVARRVVFDETNNKIKMAIGSDADSDWVDADGTNAVTPA